MNKPETARAAGEAFMITGAALGLLDLDRKPRADFEGSPEDNPGDTNVEMDEDGLAWPDRQKIEQW